MIEQGSSTTNFGDRGYVKLHGASNSSHGLLRWDLSSIAPSKTVTGACLQLTVLDDTYRTFPAFELLKPWGEFNSTWQQAADGSAWEIAGAEGPTDHAATAIGQITPGIAAGSKIYVQLTTTAVQNWVSNPSQNLGIIFINDDALTGYRIASREATQVGSRPRLWIRTN
jgi:hypothetical protein